MSDQETTRLGVNEVDASEASTRPSTSPAAVVERESEPASKEDLNRRDPLAETQAELAKIRDQLLRTAADFDNYRKRARKEAEDAQRKGSEELLRALLPVFDNLERAVLHAEQSADAKAIADGVRMVLKQFTDTLARVGIARVATVGQAFDPLVHEAIQQVETSDASPGAIVAEVAPGYRFGDRLVRAAMVVVAKSPSPKEDVVDEIAS